MWTTHGMYSYVFKIPLIVLSNVLLISFRTFCSYSGFVIIVSVDRTEWWKQRRHLCMDWQYRVYIHWMGYTEWYTATGWRHSGELRRQLFWRLVRSTVFFEQTLYMWNVKQYFFAPGKEMWQSGVNHNCHNWECLFLSMSSVSAWFIIRHNTITKAKEHLSPRGIINGNEIFKQLPKHGVLRLCSANQTRSDVDCHYINWTLAV